MMEKLKEKKKGRNFPLDIVRQFLHPSFSVKASEIIKILQKQMEEKGDVEVFFHGAYGAAEQTFEPMKDENLFAHRNARPDPSDDPTFIHIWTDIMTG